MLQQKNNYTYVTSVCSLNVLFSNYEYDAILHMVTFKTVL